MRRAERNSKLKLDSTVGFKALRFFGRALNWVGSGAKALVQSPLRVTQRRRVHTMTNQVAAEIAVEEVQPSGVLHTFHGDCMGAVQQTHQILSNQFQESADFLKSKILFAHPTSSGFLAANCFPPQLVTRKGQKSLPGSQDAQHLISAGSRELLKFKLYDFALYLDRKQVKQSKLSKRLGKKAKVNFEQGGSELRLTSGIRDSRDIEMSLVVRAARNLPIRLLAKEYERILKRRLRVVGGNPDDPALKTILEHFREEKLPEGIRQGGSVKKGTVLSFTRDWDGNIHARAQDHDLVTVTSQKLAQAVFDIYLGEQVVSRNARRDAGSSFIKMLENGEFVAPEHDLVCNDSACRVGRLY